MYIIQGGPEKILLETIFVVNSNFSEPPCILLFTLKINYNVIASIINL